MKWQYRSEVTADGEQFVLSHTTTNHRTGRWRSFNFWCISDERTMLFTFRPNALYNNNTKWNEQICQELKANLMSPKPSVKVLRFAVNDELIYAVGGCVKNSLPKIFEVYETE